MAKKLPMMTQFKYHEDPNRCPFCGSDDITGDHFEAEGTAAWRKVKCNDCEKEWREVFELTHIEDTEE